MTRAIFLDIDGVLNSRSYMEHRRHLPRPTPHSIDALTIPRLNAITDRTGAKIVISSTWRLGWNPETDPSPVWRLYRILTAHGVTGDIIDVTPSYDDSENDGRIILGRERGHEIQAWLDANPGVESFAILDDDADMVHLKHRLVQTHFETGLLDEHVERVVVMLCGGES